MNFVPGQRGRVGECLANVFLFQFRQLFDDLCGGHSVGDKVDNVSDGNAKSADGTYTINGTYTRVKSFTPAGWGPTGNVIRAGSLTQYEFARTISITFEEVERQELCVTWACPGSCWGENESTHCTEYARVLRTWTGTHTETVWVPPSSNQPPDIDRLSPRP